jgi:nitrogen regulatory protein PII
MKKIKAVIRKSKFDEVKEAQNRSQFLYLLGCYRVGNEKKDMYIEE